MTVQEEDVALRVRDVAVDLAVVRRDVMAVRRQTVVAFVVGPAHELLAPARPGAVVVDRVVVEDAAEHLVVVAIERPRVAVHAVENLLAVDQALQLPRLLGHRASPSLTGVVFARKLDGRGE